MPLAEAAAHLVGFFPLIQGSHDGPAFAHPLRCPGIEAIGELLRETLVLKGKRRQLQITIAQERSELTKLEAQLRSGKVLPTVSDEIKGVADQKQLVLDAACREFRSQAQISRTPPPGHSPASRRREAQNSCAPSASAASP